MINFAIGIFFLIIVTVLSTIYIVASGYIIIQVIKPLQFFILRRRSKNKPEALRLVKEKRKAWKNRLLSRKFIYSFLTTLIAFHLTVYLNQRARWMGENNAHLTAKEYYVAGQVLNAFRSILTNFIHPEIPILIPATWLQKQIYNQGVKHLPNNDGEIGVWQNQWFNYHYTKRGRRALFAVNWESSPETIKLLDKWWHCLETMATQPFADRNMEINHYYRDFPSLAMAYSLEKGFYSGKIIGSAHELAKLPEFVDRSRMLSGWLWDLRDKWKTSKDILRFIEKHPKVNVMSQFVTLFELSNVMHGEIYSREFNCNNQSIKRYVKLRKEFAEPDNKMPAYSRIKNRAQRERLYRITIDAAYPRSIRYLLKYCCGVTPAGKVDFSYFESWARREGISAELKSEKASRANFIDEIEILKEIGYVCRCDEVECKEKTQ